MEIHNIDLNTFKSKGYIISNIIGGELKMTSTFNTRFIRNGIGYKQCGNEMHVPSYIYLPDKYKLPLRIDMTAKIDSPSLSVMLGDGLMAFGADCNFKDISGESHESGRPIKNHIPYNEYFTISMLFDFNFMQVKVNDEIRYYSENEKYMKSKAFPEQNREGLELKITCDKRSNLRIKNITVTEYENDIPECKSPENDLSYQPWKEKVDKYDFEFCILKLSKELQNEIKLTNDYIMGLKLLKLKRKINGRGIFCKISYVSDYGFSYNIHTERNSASHSMGWILYNTRREQEKYGGIRKRELTTETLKKLAETSPEFAERMFDNLNECFGCGCSGNPKTCKLDGCIHCGYKTDYFCSTLIEYNGRKKAACHGRMEFKMTLSDFQDARKVIEAINDVLHAVSTGVSALQEAH